MAKDRIETLEINFTEIGGNYLGLYAELDAVRIHGTCRLLAGVAVVVGGKTECYG